MGYNVGMMIGKRIKDARKAKGLTQVQLAKLVGCAEQSIVNWEKEVVKPLPIFIDRLERILEVNLKEVDTDEMGNEKDPSPD